MEPIEMKTSTSRLLIDLSTMVRWHGPPVGIVRCQQKFAEFAFNNLADVGFTLFDPLKRVYRLLTRADAESILQGKLKVDMTMMPDLNPHRHHFVDRIPLRLRPLYWWLTKTRRKWVALLEKYRLRAGTKKAAGRIEKLQSYFITKKYRTLYFGDDGGRIACMLFDYVAGPEVKLTPNDTTLAIQSDWIHTDIAAIARMKREAGSRHIILCHDIIPIQFPEWYSEADAAGFKTYYDLAFSIADRVMFTSGQSAKDASAYCRSLGFEIKDSAIVPMGSDISPKKASGIPLPERLEPERYGIFVSTIEPRKNHRLLTEAWRKLVQEGIISRSRFKLVFVGRRGWKMGTFLEDIASDPILKGSLIHLENVDDATLARLYVDAAFCLYPPKFEGFGLPIVEALAYGKALIVANAGPMPEVAGGFAVVLDPDSPEAWAETMGKWIDHPEERNAHARRVKDEYRTLSWDQSARLFFEKVREPLRV